MHTDALLGIMLVVLCIYAVKIDRGFLVIFHKSEEEFSTAMQCFVRKLYVQYTYQVYNVHTIKGINRPPFGVFYFPKRSA